MPTVIKPSENSSNRRSNKKAKYLHFSDLPFEVRHQLEKLKSHIILRNASGRTKLILFSSYDHGEGTSTVVVNFAESLAQDKKCKILVVDANTRTPVLDKILSFNNPNNTLAFPDLLSQQLVKSSLALPSPSSNLILIPSGNVMYHPSQVFDHTRFANFIASVRKLFDFVIFDSSPIGRYYDSIVLASHLDGVILVVEAEKTSSSKLKSAKKMLQDRKIPILGLVLNRRKFHIPSFIFDRFFA